MIIAPVIFLTVVLGIAGMRDMRRVGRVGGKAFVYFEVVTTFALAIGLVVVNVTRPGAGIDARGRSPLGGAAAEAVGRYAAAGEKLDRGRLPRPRRADERRRRVRRRARCCRWCSSRCSSAPRSARRAGGRAARRTCFERLAAVFFRSSG
jgi:hypothetical protein